MGACQAYGHFLYYYKLALKNVGVASFQEGDPIATTTINVIIILKEINYLGTATKVWGKLHGAQIPGNGYHKLFRYFFTEIS